MKTLVTNEKIESLSKEIEDVKKNEGKCLDVKHTHEELSGWMCGAWTGEDGGKSQVKGGRTSYSTPTMRKWIRKTNEPSPRIQWNDDKNHTLRHWHLTRRKKVG